MKAKDLHKNYPFVFWDYDGVIMNSMSVRDLGFEKVLEQYPKDQIDTLLTYHRENGGLSRYHKFRYFFESIRNESITEEGVKELASDFSRIMKELLVDSSLLIQETVEFIKGNNSLEKQIVVSGSDQTELRYLTSSLDLYNSFNGVYGSPTPKNDLVTMLLILEQIDKSKACLIGDSINDKIAADKNGIKFFAYNNEELSTMENVETIYFS